MIQKEKVDWAVCNMIGSECLGGSMVLNTELWKYIEEKGVAAMVMSLNCIECLKLYVVI